MKKLLRLQSILMLLLFFVAIAGCKKDDDDNGGGGDNPAQTNYRMKEAVYAEENVESSKEVYSYESDKLSQVIEYTQPTKGDWVESEKTEVSYPSDNSFEMLTSNYASGDWNPSEKEVVTHQNGIWQSYLTYDYVGSDWSMTEKIEYTYSNGKITKEEAFVYPAGQEENEYKYIYSYVGDVPSTIDRYMWTDGNWEGSGKDTLTFSNGKLTLVETNMTMEGVSIILQSAYEYSGDNVSKITIKYNYGGMWIDFGSIIFTYDEHGNMISLVGSGQYMNYSDTFTYEEGNSNWALISGTPGFINFYGMGYSKSFQKVNNQINKIALSVLSQR
jgi:hypothetical protein